MSWMLRVTNSVDDIRTLVDQVRFAPQAGRYKVYIIDEVHMLSSSAFQCIFKNTGRTTATLRDLSF
jgi:DNA polymerase III gamma/tau subunit